MTYEEKAVALFMEGYNCAQAVFCAFADKMGMDEKLALRMASPFGGGMGRLREVCGAVSGMFMVLGVLYGYDDPKDTVTKKEIYEKVQILADRFQKENGSIICRELLGLTEKRSIPTPSERTEEYYKVRPCAAKVASAARILDEYLKEME